MVHLRQKRIYAATGAVVLVSVDADGTGIATAATAELEAAVEVGKAEDAPIKK